MLCLMCVRVLALHLCVCGCVVGMLWLVIKDVQKQKLGGVRFKGAPKRNKVAASHNV